VAEWKIMVFLLAHAPAAVLMKQMPVLGTAHALGTLLVGLVLCFAGRRFDRVAAWGAYVAGAEVIWRMTRADVFWEYGKYATALVFFIAIVRFPRPKFTALPALYFIALLPSAIPTFSSEDWYTSRRYLSGGLSGPLSLMVCAYFFSGLKVTPRQLHQVLVALVAPVFGLAAILAYSLGTATDLQFTSASNMAASGGFGPNQVSATLGLGLLIAFLIYVHEDSRGHLRRLMIGGMAWFAAQSALTFSRTGLYLGIGGIVLASLFHFQERRARMKIIVLALLLGAGTVFVILPRLDAFTGGALTKRFSDTDLTNRDHIVMEDVRIFLEHPLIGVGVGQGKEHREGGAAEHTEFSRLLAEHGLMGLLAFLCFLGMLVGNLRRARSNQARALVVGTMGWSVGFMLGTSLRLVAPSFMLGLSFVTLLTPKRPPPPARLPTANG
jgi:hypothetical protein